MLTVSGKKKNFFFPPRNFSNIWSHNLKKSWVIDQNQLFYDGKNFLVDKLPIGRYAEIPAKAPDFEKITKNHKSASVYVEQVKLPNFKKRISREKLTISSHSNQRKLWNPNAHKN